MGDWGPQNCDGHANEEGRVGKLILAGKGTLGFPGMLHSTRRARLRPFFHLTIWTLLLPPCCLGTESAGGLEPGSGATNTSNGNLANPGKTFSAVLLLPSRKEAWSRAVASQIRARSRDGFEPPRIRVITNPSHHGFGSRRIRAGNPIRKPTN